MLVQQLCLEGAISSPLIRLTPASLADAAASVGRQEGNLHCAFAIHTVAKCRSRSGGAMQSLQQQALARAVPSAAALPRATCSTPFKSAAAGLAATAQQQRRQQACPRRQCAAALVVAAGLGFGQTAEKKISKQKACPCGSSQEYKVRHATCCQWMGWLGLRRSVAVPQLPATGLQRSCIGATDPLLSFGPCRALRRWCRTAASGTTTARGPTPPSSSCAPGTPRTSR